MPDCLPFCGRTKGGIFLSRLSIEHPGQAQIVLNGLYREMGRRINASSPGLCPVDMALNFVRLSHAQTCGKCVPCRVGLGQLAVLIESVLDRTATLETIDLIERTAQVIADSADCAIGYEAAHMVLKGVRGFREDYEEPSGALRLGLPGPRGHSRLHLTGAGRPLRRRRAPHPQG